MLQLLKAGIQEKKTKEELKAMIGKYFSEKLEHPTLLTLSYTTAKISKDMNHKIEVTLKLADILESKVEGEDFCNGLKTGILLRRAEFTPKNSTTKLASCRLDRWGRGDS